MKTMQLTKIFLICALFFTVSCTTYLKMWGGKTKQELVAKMGPPAHTNSDEKGGEILTYERKVLRNVQVLRYHRYVTEQRLHLEKTMFYLDTAGKVYNVINDYQPTN
jgi:hypothetical protein